jgi:hypothetical protein
VRRENFLGSFVFLTSLFSLLTFSAGEARQKPADFKGLQMTATRIDRAMNVSLIDCPPGTNTVRGNAKPGETFIVVNVAFKVGASFKETVVKKPVLVATDGKTYNTSVAIIDPGSKPEYTCQFPFRVPDGTKAGKIQIDAATIDLTSLDK